MSRMADHLIIAPVVLPLLAGAATLLLGERRHGLKAAIGVASVGIAIALLVTSDAEPRFFPSRTGIAREHISVPCSSFC
jgi:multicomponent K+:H+ antiporter subunit D